MDWGEFEKHWGRNVEVEEKGATRKRTRNWMRLPRYRICPEEDFRFWLVLHVPSGKVHRHVRQCFLCAAAGYRLLLFQVVPVVYHWAAQRANDHSFPVILFSPPVASSHPHPPRRPLQIDTVTKFQPCISRRIWSNSIVFSRCAEILCNQQSEGQLLCRCKNLEGLLLSP